MPMQRNILKIYKRIYFTERKGVAIDGERIKFSKQAYEVVCSNCILKHTSGEGVNPTIFYLSCIINANPYEELDVKVGDKVVLNNQEYFVTFVDNSNYRNILVEAKS